MEADMATVTAAPTPARTVATATLVTAPAIARIPMATAAIMGATTADTTDTTGVTAAITINSERDQGHRVVPRLAPVFPPAIAAVIWRPSGGMH